MGKILFLIQFIIYNLTKNSSF